MEGARRTPSVCASRGIGAASSLREGAKGRGKNVRGGIDKSPALPYNNSEERTTHTVSSSKIGFYFVAKPQKPAVTYAEWRLTFLRALPFAKFLSQVS